MLHRTSFTIAGIGVAAALAVGVGLFASNNGDGSYGTSRSTTSAVSTSSIGTATATVSGKSQTILTDSRGMPLYYYAQDGPTKSSVSGGLAALWPAVTANATPNAAGLTGSLTVVSDSHGSQVAYKGHLLYTFVSDRPGVVTGQGVENFFVATTTLPTLAGSATS